MLKQLKILLVVGLSGCAMVGTPSLLASDHDDGQAEALTADVNITDLFVFREGDQNGVVGDNENLIFILNTYPRALPQTQVYFNTKAYYEFYIARVGATDTGATTTSLADVVMRFKFDEAQDDNLNKQKITATFIRDSISKIVTETTDEGNLVTTPLPGTTAVINTVSAFDTIIEVFAGMREDPFFFDVTQFALFKAAVLASPTTGFSVLFNAVATARDFAVNYNVNTIAVKVPIAFLSRTDAEEDDLQSVFDVWARTSVEIED